MIRGVLTGVSEFSMLASFLTSFTFAHNASHTGHTNALLNGDFIVSPRPAQELEQVWRIRTELAKQRYDECTQELKRLAAEVLRGQPSVSDEAILQARMRESDALHEYKRLLQIYTQIILHGKVQG